MFKYVWIIMIVVVIALFIAYTIWALYDTYEIYGFSTIADLIDDFSVDHTFLYSIWLAILLISFAGLFVASIVTWLKSRG